MASLVLEVCLALILILLCRALVRGIDAFWVKPRKIKAILEKQGIPGPTATSLLHGNMHEIMMIESATPKPNPTQQDSIVHTANYMYPYFWRWTKDYGPVFKYSTGSKVHLYVSDPDLLKLLNLHKSLDLGTPAYMGKILEPILGDGIVMANGHNWAHQRKLIAPEFFAGKVKGMVGLLVESTMSMLRNWETQMIKSGDEVAEVRIDEDMKDLSADVILKACFGTSYAQGQQIFQNLRTMQEIKSKIGLDFDHPSFSYLPTKKNRDIWRLQKEMEMMIGKVVQDRQQETEKRSENEKDLLQAIIEEGSLVNHKKMTRSASRFILDVCKNIYFAGNETTASATTWCLMLLALYPQWQQRLRDEILEVYGQNVSPDLDTLYKLKMMTMVIQETLRLYGPSTILSREVFGDLKFGGLFVPQGTTIWSLVPALHRDSNNWGPDANEFNPERFANGVSKSCKYPSAYLPFGYGTRLCLGQTFAIAQIKIVLSLILSKYNLSISPNYRHSPIAKMIIVPEYGIQLLFKKI